MLFTIGRTIRDERKRRKLTQGEVAAAAGIARATLSQIENGSIREIGIRKLIRVLDCLDLEMATRPRGAPPTLEELRREWDAEG